MRLKALDASTLPAVSGWLTRKENYEWLDFGHGTQILTPPSLKLMTQRDIHCFRVFSAEPDDTPVGLVAFSDISFNFRTATLWYVLGNKSYRSQGYTTRAVSAMLTLGFSDLKLEAVRAWAVEHNEPSIRILKRNNFQMVGRQRRCHYIDDHPFDRLLFDLLAAEHREM